MICKAMEWNHLPVAGGIYDQSPELLNQFLDIWKAESEVAERKRKEQEAQRRASTRGRRK